MRRLLLLVTALSVSIFFGGSVLMAQDSSATAPATASAASKGKTKMAAHHHAAAVEEETMSGAISMVDADKHIVVVTDSNGVPFDFVVNGHTKIMVGGQKAKLSDLSSATSKQASVKYRALKKAGDVASSIDVSS